MTAISRRQPLYRRLTVQLAVRFVMVDLCFRRFVVFFLLLQLVLWWHCEFDVYVIEVLCMLHNNYVKAIPSYM
jgi:hypothetical protein